MMTGDPVKVLAMQKRIEELTDMVALSDVVIKSLQDQLRLHERGRPGRIKLRNDAGPDGTLSETKLLHQIGGVWYEREWILSAPGLHEGMIEWD